MRTETITLPTATPGTLRTLAVQRFGAPGARPRAHIQAALHADEIPGMLVAARLRALLAEREAAGALTGEVVLVPVANPLGLAQQVLGSALGRFDLADGANFNRDFPYLTERVATRVGGRLGADAAANVALIRGVLAAEIAALEPRTPAAQLKKALLGLAAEADLVLDLHCDAEAAMHLYTLTASAGTFEPLARLLGAEAVLLADESGGDPFDEAASRPWHELRARFPDRPIPLACHTTTVEHRGQADVDDATAEADARAILGFLMHSGIVAGDPPALPAARCQPTPLAASEPVEAPVGGILVFRQPVGARVQAGEVIAEVVDPVEGTTTPVRGGSAGVLYARVTSRFAVPGQRIAKIAGTTLSRSGRLLSA